MGIFRLSSQSLNLIIKLSVPLSFECFQTVRSESDCQTSARLISVNDGIHRVFLQLYQKLLMPKKKEIESSGALAKHLTLENELELPYEVF